MSSSLKVLGLATEMLMNHSKFELPIANVLSFCNLVTIRSSICRFAIEIGVGANRHAGLVYIRSAKVHEGRRLSVHITAYIAFCIVIDAFEMFFTRNKCACIIDCNCLAFYLACRYESHVIN